MKTTSLLLSFLLFALVATKASLGAAIYEGDPVVDIDGKEVETGTNYYILPAIRGNGGGVSLALHRNGCCPFDVVQDRFEISRGLPVTFSPVNATNVVRLSTYLNIKFSVFTPCVESTVWQHEFFVTTGGVEGNTELLNNWFKIEKYNNLADVYVLQYCRCPNLFVMCRIACSNVGIYFMDGKRHLVLGGDRPLSIMFKKAEGFASI